MQGVTTLLCDDILLMGPSQLAKTIHCNTSEHLNSGIGQFYISLISHNVKLGLRVPGFIFHWIDSKFFARGQVIQVKLSALGGDLCDRLSNEQW